MAHPDLKFIVCSLMEKSIGLKRVNNVRICHKCEGRIEKSVLRIAFWHHEACQVMTNGDLEGRIFLSYPHANNGFFFLLTTDFIFILK